MAVALCARSFFGSIPPALAEGSLAAHKSLGPSQAGVSQDAPWEARTPELEVNSLTL